jgi:hypothetical protein
MCVTEHTGVFFVLDTPHRVFASARGIVGPDELSTESAALRICNALGARIETPR